MNKELLISAFLLLMHVVVDVTGEHVQLLP